MDTIEIKARLAEVQIEMEDLLEIRRSSSIATAVEVGTDALAGINLDNLSKWAREMRVVNTRLATVIATRTPKVPPQKCGGIFYPKIQGYPLFY